MAQKVNLVWIKITLGFQTERGGVYFRQAKGTNLAEAFQTLFDKTKHYVDLDLKHIIGEQAKSYVRSLMPTFKPNNLAPKPNPKKRSCANYKIFEKAV